MNLVALKKHICLYFMVYLTVLQTFASRWVISFLGVPSLVNKVITLALYIPFFAFILWKLILDIKGRNVELFSILYYAFAGYYAILSVYRFFAGLEVKENLYYTIILLGSIAIFDLIYKGAISLDKHTFVDDLCMFSVFILLYMLVFVVFFKRHIYYCPINEIAIGGSLVLLIIAVALRMYNVEKNDILQKLCPLIVFGLTATAFTLKSRVVFVVFLLDIILISLYFLRKKKVAVKFLAAVLCAVLLVVVLFVFNVGEVRYAIYRETKMFGNLVATEPSGDAGPNHSDSVLQQQVSDQVLRSDNMRSALLEESIKQVKKNPLFGTGDVFYAFDVNGEIFDAPAHNFVFATLNCYGIIGALFIFLIFVIMVSKTGIFNLQGFLKIGPACILILISFFSIGMLQATVYDMQVLPVLAILLGQLLNMVPLSKKVFDNGKR